MNFDLFSLTSVGHIHGYSSAKILGVKCIWNFSLHSQGPWQEYEELGKMGNNPK